MKLLAAEGEKELHKNHCDDKIEDDMIEIMLVEDYLLQEFDSHLGNIPKYKTPSVNILLDYLTSAFTPTYHDNVYLDVFSSVICYGSILPGFEGWFESEIIELRDRRVQEMDP